MAYYRPPCLIKVFIYAKKPTLYGFCTKPTKSALKSVKKIYIRFFGYFLSFSVLLFPTAFVSALKTPFGAFESYFYGLGSTVTHKKFFLFDTQKLPKNREFLAWDLFCNIDMELVTGLEPATCSLRMSCTTNCATQAY